MLSFPPKSSEVVCENSLRRLLINFLISHTFNFSRVISPSLPCQPPENVRRSSSSGQEQPALPEAGGAGRRAGCRPSPRFPSPCGGAAASARPSPGAWRAGEQRGHLGEVPCGSSFPPSLLPCHIPRAVTAQTAARAAPVGAAAPRRADRYTAPPSSAPFLPAVGPGHGRHVSPAARAPTGEERCGASARRVAARPRGVCLEKGGVRRGVPLTARPGGGGIPLGFLPRREATGCHGGRARTVFRIALGASVTALLALVVVVKSGGEARVQHARHRTARSQRNDPGAHGLPAPSFPCPPAVLAPGAARAARQVALFLQRGPRWAGAGRGGPCLLATLGPWARRGRLG